MTVETQPVVSVVVSSDYAAGAPEGWADLRSTLAGLAKQDFDEPAEFLFVETPELAPQIPPDILAILPSLRVVTVAATAASQLQNAGVRAARANLVAMLDADCTPATGWLRHLVTALREHPEVAAVSGRTTYGKRSLLHRVMALSTRSFLDENRTAPTRHVTINNAGFRRAVALAHPMSETSGAHSSMLQSEPIAREGGKFLFEPGMHVVHSYGGWSMERQIRCSMGYGVIKVRRQDPRIRWAWMAHLGLASIPLFVLLRTLHSWRNCLRCAGAYDVAWYELPAALALAAAACVIEAPGMLRAVRDQPPLPSPFR